MNSNIVLFTRTCNHLHVTLGFLPSVKTKHLRASDQHWRPLPVNSFDHLRQAVTFVMPPKKSSGLGAALQPLDVNQETLREARSQKRKATSPTPQEEELKPSAKCFCNMHELLYETKATGKEQYHNNFGCYGFIARSNASYPIPTFRKRWSGSWMEEWFYVKNNLIEREDIKGIIQRPILSLFGLRRLTVAFENDAEACQKAFSNVCAFIGTRDLIQEHIAYRVWPLVDNWEMPKETAARYSQGGLIHLKYTFRYRDRFDEPNDDWLKCIDATSDELLGAYTRAKDDALSSAFGGRGKKRLNKVFDAIGFIYPDYCYPSRKQGKKRKTATLAISAVLKGKKIKVLTHQPRYIETTIVPKFGEETSSAAEAEQAAPAARSAEESTIVPKVPIFERVEAEDGVAKKPEFEKTIVLPRASDSKSDVQEISSRSLISWSNSSS
jgi:hypothetical protein